MILKRKEFKPVEGMTGEKNLKFDTLGNLKETDEAVQKSSNW